MTRSREEYSIVILKSNEGDEVKLSRDIVVHLRQVHTAIDDMGQSIGIPIPNVNTKTLKDVVRYCTEYSKLKSSEEAWEITFNDINFKYLCDVFSASNYLEIQPLLDEASKAVARIIKGRSVVQLREIFNLTNDFSCQEEQGLREEYKSLYIDVDQELLYQPVLRLPLLYLLRLPPLRLRLQPPPDFDHFPTEIWYMIFMQCGPADIYKLLLTCRSIYLLLRDSFWWREQVDSNVGSISGYEKADPESWRRLYLAYLEGTIRTATVEHRFADYIKNWTAPSVGWKLAGIRIREFPSSLYEHDIYRRDLFRCFTDGHNLILAQCDLCYVSSYIITHILVRTSATRGILVQDKRYRRIWSEPVEIRCDYRHLDEIIFYRPVDLHLRFNLHRIPWDGRPHVPPKAPKPRVTLKVSGTRRNVLQTISDFLDGKELQYYGYRRISRFEKIDRQSYRVAYHGWERHMADVDEDDDDRDSDDD